MKFLQLAFLTTIFCSVASLAQIQHIQTILSVVDKNNFGVQLTFGLDAAATDGRDSSMGENQKPGHPPSGMHALLFLPTNDDDLCYRDFRKLTSEPLIIKQFRIEVQPASARGNEPIYFKWTYPLEKGIDSIIVYDRKTSGMKASFALDSRRQFIVSDEYADSFIMTGYYRAGATDVAEDFKIAQTLCPNPAQNFLNIKGVADNESVEIVDVDGQSRQVVMLPNNSISVADLTPGVYAAVASGNSNKRFLGMFVKQ